MKYAALIFGDDERQPKAASGKLPSPEPGQIVRGIDGSVYRVASKIAGPDGFAVKLASLRGQPVQTPHNFRSVSRATAHFASWLKYHLAYNRDFDLYINSYIERYNQQHPDEPLPYPAPQKGHSALNWADWFQKVISPKLYVPGQGDARDKQVVKDELIHEMLFTVLGHRDVLSQFVAKAKSLGVNRENAASKLRDFLISTFIYRIDEMRNKLKERHPEGEVSIFQPSISEEGESEKNILDTEEYGTGTGEFESAEARRDVAKFREGFRKWLEHTQGQDLANNFITLFDIFWGALQSDEDAQYKRGDLQQEWMDETGLSLGSFKTFFYALPDMVEKFIMSHSAELGDKNIFIDLMDVIRAEREGGERRKERVRPAMASLNIAAAESDKTASTGLECSFIEYQPGKWYYLLENWNSPKGGWDWREYADAYGPFTSEEAAVKHMQDNHANPGGWSANPYNPAFAKDKVLAKLISEAHSPAPQRRSRWGSSKTAQKLVRGDQLTPDQVKQVKNSFIYRWTSDNSRRGEVYHCDKCDVQQNPYVNTQSAEGHQHPTIPLQTDEQWLGEHAFYFTNAGKLQPNRHAQPAYLAPDESDPILASVAHKFAMEKAAYNPGKGEYIYKADVYCEKCGKKLVNKLWGTANDQGDSDTFPQGPYYNQEADGPQHCANCGEFLENPLTEEGYSYLNQMILEHEADGKGQSDIIDEWKAFYPEREEMDDSGVVDATLSQIEQDTDKDFLKGMNTAGKKGGVADRYMSPNQMMQEFDRPGGQGDRVRSGEKFEEKEPEHITTRMRRGLGDPAIDMSKKGMIPHEFNDADGQAIRNETYSDTAYVSGEADTTELRQRRQAAIEQWKCMDCGNVGALNREGNCESCDSQAVYPETPAVQRPALPVEPKDTSTFRETKPVEVEKRMVPIRQRNISPNPNPRLGADKTAQGSGNTTVTMQNQNVTTPNTPGKGQPLAVPDAIDQVPGPHSPNAPATAPRSPGIQPRVVNVPAGTEGDDTMSIPQTASANDPEEITCPKCGGDNVDIDADEEEGYKIYCEDCEQVTHQGRLVPGNPVRDYSETPGDEWTAIERMGEIEGELDSPEPDFDSMYEEERLDQFDKGAAAEEGSIPDEYNLDILFAMPQGQKEEWLVAHGWVKDDEWHGASWWMQKPMWSRTDYEESIPYQDTDEAMDKEIGIWERSAKQAAGSNSGDDDARGVGDLYRENFYEHRTKGLSTDGMLTGMKEAASQTVRTAAINVAQGEDAQGFHMIINMNGREYILRGPDADAFRREYAAISKPEGKVNALVEKYMGKLQPYGEKPKADPRAQAPAAPKQPKKTWVPTWMRRQKTTARSRGIKAKKAVSLSSAEQLAREFARELTLELGPETMKEVVELNGAETLPNVCHSHDFCDANMTMQRAGANLGLWKDNEADVNDEATVKLWNEAWEIAVDNNFWVGESKAAAVAPPPAPVVSPNVVQNQSLAQNPGVQAPGTSVAVIPEEGQGQEDPGTLKRHTVEPELPNARYHMMGALAAEEESRLLQDPEYSQWLETLKQSEGMECEECGQAKPDVTWQEFPDLGALDPADYSKHLQGFFCGDCAGDIAQDI